MSKRVAVLYDSERNPPDDRARVRLFLSAVDDYQRLHAAVPLPKAVQLVPSLVDERLYWEVILHGAVRRKFFAPREQVKLTTVTRSLDALLADASETTEAELVAVRMFDDSHRVPSYSAYNVNGNQVTVWELLEVELYGRYLHSDYGKWAVSTGPEQNTHYSAMVDWCRGAHRIVSELARVIREAEESGSLRL